MSSDHGQNTAFGVFLRKRWIVISIVVIVSLCAVAARYIPSIIFCNRIKHELEAIFKTRVDIGDAELSLFLNHGEINDVTVYNPPGYNENGFLKVSRITFKMKSDTMQDNVVYMDYVRFYDVVMYVETSGETSNLRETLRMISVPADVMDVVVSIDSLKIFNGSIKSRNEDATESSTPFPLKEIHNVHGNSQMIAEQVGTELRNAMDSQVKDTMNDLMKGLTKGVSDFFSF